MDWKTRPIPKCTTEVEISRRAMEHRKFKSECSVLPDTKGMIKIALVGLVVAVLGYITYLVIKKKDK